jgi:hypothetical protein
VSSRRNSSAAAKVPDAPPPEAAKRPEERFGVIVRRIQERSVAAGLDQLTDEDIEAEVQAVRAERAKRSPEENRAAAVALRARLDAARHRA